MDELADDDALHRLVTRRLAPQWYRRVARPAKRVLAEQLLILENFREDIGIRGIHRVEGRVKSEESVTKSLLSRRYESIYDFPDIVGIRIVVHSLRDVEIVAQCFLRQVGDKVKLLGDEQKDKDGYQARHLDLEIQGSFLRLSGMPVRMEVQIRTLGQEMFDTLSRSYWYKSENVIPDEAHRAALDGQLRPAEDHVINLQRHAEAAHASDPNEPMSPDSFIRIVGELLNETVPLGEAVETVLYQRDRGIQTNGDLRKVFTDKETRGKVAELLQLAASLPAEKRLFANSAVSRGLYLMVAGGGFDLIKQYLQNEIGKLTNADEGPSE